MEKKYKIHITISIPLELRHLIEEKRQAEEINTRERVTTSAIISNILLDNLKSESARQNK